MAHTSTDSDSSVEEASGWTGWVVFAALLMIMMGSFQAFLGFVAIWDDGYFVRGANVTAVNFDYTTWGWIHLIVGLLAFFAGIAVLSGQTWGRAVGVVLAAAAAVVNFGFLSAEPVWATLLITINVIVIYALTAHGRELRRY